MDEESKVGKCKSCGNKYEIEKYIRDENPHFSGWEFRPCTKCGYDQTIEKQIKEIIDRSTKFEITLCPEKPVQVNSEELTDLIAKALLKFWPKKKHN